MQAIEPRTRDEFARALVARVLTAAALGLVMAALGTARAQAANGQPVPLRNLPLRDSEGNRIVLPPAELTVVCFLGTECPLARLYGPRLEAMAKEWDGSDVLFVGINSNPQDSPADVGRYADEHGIEFPIAKDSDQTAANLFDATRTPEVFVLDRTGRIRYRGRIDDQYQPGTARPTPTQHDLRDAIQALLDGRAVARIETEAVGCAITRLDRVARERAAGETGSAGAGAAGAGGEGPQVTFTRDIAPILNRRCVECHRDEAIGPFALTDYDEVVGWGEMILEVIDQGRMPPWHADPSIGHFTGSRRMGDAERDTLAAWIGQGMPEGDPQDLPELPTWAGGWDLPTAPDVELEMRDRPFAVPAQGTVEYQYFVVDPGWETDRWVRAAQVIPGDARVVHHTIVFVRPPDGSQFRGVGWLGGYVPGQRSEPLPSGHARRVPAGSKLVFQMHYTPNGRESEDLTRLGVWFADPKEVTDEVFTRVALDQDFEIPPGAADHSVVLKVDSFPRASRLLAVMPHMHLRGKSFRLDVHHSEHAKREHTETVLSVPQYDFNWQHWYRFAQPLALDDIRALEMTVQFDNSTGNPSNPDPGEYVTWGDQTWEEMAVAFLDIAQPRQLPESAPRGGMSSPGQEEGTFNDNASDGHAESDAVRSEVESFLAAMDADGDGVMTREETPLTFRSFGFWQLDRNRDGRLDRNEIEAAAASRQ